jgi:DNA-binding transcriptional LysR family regulator
MINGRGHFNWNDLLFFLELARQGRLMPAAKRLKVDHTTVSRRIAELERALGCKLFDRTSEGFALADAGQRLLPYAEAMETSALSITSDVGGMVENLSGAVRLATMEGIASLYLAGHMREFQEKHPSILVELVTAAHLLNLTRREADISLSFAKPMGPRLAARKIGEFELRLYASPIYLQHRGEPRSPDELVQHDFVDYIDDLVSIREVRWLHDVIRPSNIVFQSSSMIAQHNAAAAGMGLVLLPSFAAARDDRLRPVLVGQVSVKRNLWLTVHEDLRHLRRIKAVLQFLTQLIERDGDFLNGRAP